jgi:hypothetical protein
VAPAISSSMGTGNNMAVSSCHWNVIPVVLCICKTSAIDVF